ncbi:MAG: hypothetical protein HC923_00930 [Myxococcales bacterium]|nr:hypothetical protein [Myxococcales bacterium]
MSMVENQVRARVEELGDDPSDEIREAAWIVWADRTLGGVSSASDVADLIDDALRRLRLPPFGR